MKKFHVLLFIFNVLLILLFELNSCNNPFTTRDPEKPGSEGAAIKPPKSPENVLDNLEASFEGLSIQDYLDIFSEAFAFHPDSGDSTLFEEDFRYGWKYDKEELFANNFLQRNNFKEDIEGSPIDLSVKYEYKPGQDMYEYQYHMFILQADTTDTIYNRIEIEGLAWLFLSEDTEGKWSIYKWVDFRLRSDSFTWGILRALNI